MYSQQINFCIFEWLRFVIVSWFSSLEVMTFGGGLRTWALDMSTQTLKIVLCRLDRPVRVNSDRSYTTSPNKTMNNVSIYHTGDLELAPLFAARAYTHTYIHIYIYEHTYINIYTTYIIPLII